MSEITNLLLSFSVGEDEDARMKDVNEFQHRGRNLNLASANFSVGGMKWYSGSKNMDTPLYVGVFNHFNLDEFLLHLAEINWEDPECVQVIVKGEEDDIFKIHHLSSSYP